MIVCVISFCFGLGHSLLERGRQTDTHKDRQTDITIDRLNRPRRGCSVNTNNVCDQNNIYSDNIKLRGFFRKNIQISPNNLGNTGGF